MPTDASLQIDAMIFDEESAKLLGETWNGLIVV